MDEPPRQSGHRWEPITDLPDDLRKFPSQELDALASKWRSQVDAMGESDLITRFNRRLIREWSIETGILERLYTLDAGVTLTLVQQGFDSALVSSGDSDLGAEQLMQILGDHKHAAEGLFAFVKTDRQLTTSYINELHAALTAHQETCEGVDQFGVVRHVPLRRGEYKTLPNNPGDPRTGEMRHEYCPPEHVDAEMDRLLAFHGSHGDVAFVVQAAWLHHRFTQIHPFQDGNGRVARSLATLLCLRAGSLPLVVTRGDKGRYIGALEAADRGELRPLVELFQRLQKHRLLEALSLTEESTPSAINVDEIIASAKDKVDRARSFQAEKLRERAERLIEIALGHYSTVAGKLYDAGFQAKSFASAEDNDYFFRQQIVDVAKRCGYYANLRGVKHWAHLRIGDGTTFHAVVAVHHLGRIEDGVMVASAFSFRRGAEVPDSSSQFSELTPDFEEDDLFTFTADRDEYELVASFEQWSENCLQVALAKWQKGL